jgi:pyruvate kinase
VTDAALLLDGGKLRREIERCGVDFADSRVVAGGRLFKRKGVNMLDVVLPITALTRKDRRDLDLDLALGLGADRIALSFAQRPEDVASAVQQQGRRGCCSKISSTQTPNPLQMRRPRVSVRRPLKVRACSYGLSSVALASPTAAEQL